MDNRWHAYGHEEEIFNLAPRFLAQITNEKKLIDSVLPLVRWHGQPYYLHKAGAGDAAVRRLANKVVRIDRLCRVDLADRRGRGTASMHGPSPHGEWLAERAAALQVASTAPKKIVLGRHLIAMGHKPAGWFSQVLDEAFEAQLDGVFGDEAGGLAWLTERMAKGVV
jgi:tRNA nucleotidyltransferase (CCA-adding enzyme)